MFQEIGFWQAYSASDIFGSLAAMLNGQWGEGTLAGAASLCRSDSGFHNVSSTMDELTLDLAPIEEHHRDPKYSDIFGNTGYLISFHILCFLLLLIVLLLFSASSPMRIPGTEGGYPMSSPIFHSGAKASSVAGASGTANFVGFPSSVQHGL